MNRSAPSFEPRWPVALTVLTISVLVVTLLDAAIKILNQFVASFLD